MGFLSGVYCISSRTVYTERTESTGHRGGFWGGGGGGKERGFSGREAGGFRGGGSGREGLGRGGGEGRWREEGRVAGEEEEEFQGVPRLRVRGRSSRATPEQCTAVKPSTKPREGCGLKADGSCEDG